MKKRGKLNIPGRTKVLPKLSLARITHWPPTDLYPITATRRAVRTYLAVLQFGNLVA